MKIQVYVIAVIFLITSTYSTVAADKNSEPPAMIGTIAPFVTLPLINSTGTSPWNSIDSLGKNAIVYMVVPPQMPLERIQDYLPAYSKKNTDQKAINVFVVLPKKAYPGDLQQWPILIDKKHLLLRRYAPKSTSITAIIIDRAGFLRQIRSIHSKQDIQRLLQSIKNFKDGEDVQAGEKAPDFIIRDMNGTVRSLHQLRKKKHLLLTFFPKCFTFTCGMQLSSLRDSWSTLQSKNLEIWGVSVDTAEGPRGQKAFAEHLQLKFPLLPDSGHQLSLLYGSVYSTKQMSARMSVLIDKKGIIRWVDKQIDPRHYGEDVIAKMEELSLQ